MTGLIVALDAASADQSVAVADERGATLATVAWTAPRGQGGELLPHLLELLRDLQASLVEVRAVGVGLGPGSFTGLRVAVSLGKGLAAGLACPLVGVPSLDAWLTAEPDAVAALVRAGSTDVHVQHRGHAAPRTVAIDQVGTLLPTGRIVVPRDLVAELSGVVDLREARPPDAAASAIARVTARRLAAGQADDLGRLEPHYGQAPRGLSAAGTEGARWR